MLNETVQDTLNRMGLLTEMSVPLKKYRERVDGLRFQLVENWCLCKYCQLFDKKNRDFDHWICEFRSVVTNLKFLDIKGGASKKKTLFNMLVRDYDYNSPNMIERITSDKFAREEITDASKTKTVCAEFAKDIEQIVCLISNEKESVDFYIKETFLK